MLALSFYVFSIVLKQNSFAASTITVEADQPVISTGAYAIVRHPLYSGALLFLLSTPLALGSYWTLLLLVPLFAVLAWRLLDEERFLKQNLPGYVEYCNSTRFRLIPLDLVATGHSRLTASKSRCEECRHEARHGGVDIAGPSHDADIGKFRPFLAREMREDAFAQSRGIVN